MARLNDPMLNILADFRDSVDGTGWQMLSPTFNILPIKIGKKYYNRCTIELYQEIPDAETDTTND